VELHNVLPHHDHILRVDSLHLTECVQDLSVSVDAIMLESRHDLLNKEAGQHVVDLDILYYVLLSFKVTFDGS